MGMADDANKRIDLATPLISVRRHGGAGAEATALLSSYKPGEASGRPGDTGAVRSGWEHRPPRAHPKSVRTRRPPPTTVGKDATSPTQEPPAAAIAAAARAVEERFSDARSRGDVSCCVAVKCSATAGLSHDGAVAAAAHGSRGSAGMTDRFLPAAHAVAVASPLSAFRKAGSVREPARRPAVTCKRASDGDDNILPTQGRLLPLQHIPTNHLHILPPQVKSDDDDDDEWDVRSTQGSASMKCGLLPTRCVKSTLLLLLNPATAMRRSRGARRRGEGRSFVPRRGGTQSEMNPLLRRSRSGQQQPRHDEGRHDPGTAVSWEELYVKSLLLRSAGGSLMGPAAAVASELDRRVRELYRRRGGGETVQPMPSHLGLLLVLEDRSNEQRHGSPVRNAAVARDTALLLPRAKSSPHAGGKFIRRGPPADNAGGYGFKLLPEDKAASPGGEIGLSPLPLPMPKSPSESWLSRALPSVSSRPPPATSFLGLHVQSGKLAPLPLVLH